uniref:Bifunctional inhibitor/plant lipid transfer protein/seed storage helical domain-containing protein n=1 Tax=Oryza nivara TaxID=4536 RepID=A0A0E0HSP0_ORYNI
MTVVQHGAQFIVDERVHADVAEHVAVPQLLDGKCASVSIVLLEAGRGGEVLECPCVRLNAVTTAFRLSIKRTRALGLPDACKVQMPPFSNYKSNFRRVELTNTASPPIGGAVSSVGQTLTFVGTGSKVTLVTAIGSGVVPLRVSLVGILAGLVVVAVYAISTV